MGSEKRNSGKGRGGAFTMESVFQGDKEWQCAETVAKVTGRGTGKGFCGRGTVQVVD